jgi:2'-deoxynucleoside 5'-phosphate N-hydrolase
MYMPTMKVYISGALQAAINLAASKDLYEAAAAVVIATGHDAYVPHLHTDPITHSGRTSTEVYETDIAQLTTSDAVIAFIDSPSLGVGAEIAIALHRAIPIVALRRTENRVSRFVEGLLIAHGCQIVPYEDKLDLQSNLPAIIIEMTTTASWKRRAAE